MGLCQRVGDQATENLSSERGGTAGGPGTSPWPISLSDQPSQKIKLRVSAEQWPRMKPSVQGFSEQGPCAIVLAVQP